jgi:uncharacterized membrane protein YdjX (TVP38/TMEM64 family)
VMCGLVMGLLWGVVYCQLAATISALLTFYFSHWLAGAWFHQRVETRMARLRKLDKRLGHNGFLVVIGVRLTHVIPFALSNYLFGLTTITAIDVVLGTLLGNLPGATMYVTLGADPKLMQHGMFWTGMVTMNGLLIVPVALRYLRPDWFRRIGVE